MNSKESHIDSKETIMSEANDVRLHTEKESVLDYITNLTDTHRSAGPRGYKKDMYLTQYDAHLDTKYSQFKVFQNFTIMRLYHDWPKVVGTILSKQTHLIAIEPPIIKVGALNSPCLQQLQMMKRQLLQKINAYYGKEIIMDIQLSMYRQSYIKDKGQVDYGATAGSTQYERTLVNFETISISETELEAIDKVVATISEPNLRNIFRDTQIKQYKKIKYLKAHGYHTCLHCESLVGPNDTVCMSCTLKAKEKADYAYRQHIEAIKSILWEQPYLVYEAICKQIPQCTMTDYQLAHKECVYFFRNRVIRQASDDNYDVYMLLMLITHKDSKKLEKDFVKNAVKKMRHQYEQKRANYEGY